MSIRERIRGILFGTAKIMGALALVMYFFNPAMHLRPILVMFAISVALWVLALLLGWGK